MLVLVAAIITTAYSIGMNSSICQRRVVQAGLLLQNELISNKKHYSKFNLYEFIGYAAHEIRWLCVESSCTLWSMSGMHLKALQDCVSPEQFCNHFNIKFEKCVHLSHHNIGT